MANILIVDDEPNNRDLLKRRLVAAGHDVDEREDGEQALKAVSEKKPDLLILDVMMPKVDGWEVCKKVKSDPLTSSIPILMLTARGDASDELMSAEMGADSYLPKPWNLAKLLEAVNALIKS